MTNVIRWLVRAGIICNAISGSLFLLVFFSELEIIFIEVSLMCFGLSYGLWRLDKWVVKRESIAKI